MAAAAAPLAIGALGSVLGKKIGGGGGSGAIAPPNIKEAVEMVRQLSEELKEPISIAGVETPTAPSLTQLLAEIGGGGLVSAIRRARGAPGSAEAASAAVEQLGNRVLPLFAQQQAQAAAQQAQTQLALRQMLQSRLAQREAERGDLLRAILAAQAGVEEARFAGESGTKQARIGRKGDIISSALNLVTKLPI